MASRFLTVIAFSVLAALPAGAQQIRSIAGDGTPGHSGDGGPARKAQLHDPFGITRGPDGLLYFCEFNGHVVRRIAKDGTLATVAGNGTPGHSGDGGPATAGQLNKPHEIRFGPDGNLYIADMSSHSIRCVEMATGTLRTVAGTGTAGFSGDGGPAVKAQFNEPISIQFGPDGLLYICDIGNQRVRTLDIRTGIVDTVCGTGKKDATPDGAPFSPATPLTGPRSLDFDPDGNLWLALREGNALYRMDAKTRTLQRIAGTGKAGFTGNGGPPAEATLSGPKGLTISPKGRIYIADTESHSVRVIDLKRDRIEVVAGTGKKGAGKDGAAARCPLARPHGVFLDKDGTLYIGDSENHQIRAVKVE